MNNIVFVKIPEKFASDINGFRIDTNIPLPIEKTQNMENGSLEDLSWEQIIAAMLKILAFHRDFHHIDYYRNFIIAIRPELLEQLIDAGIEKARSKNFTVAEEIFLAVEGLEPDNIVNLINMALLYEHKASSVDTFGVVTHMEAEKSNDEKKYLDMAFDTYKKALYIDPSSEHLHYHAGQFFLNQQNYEKAKEHFTAYLDITSVINNYEDEEEEAETVQHRENIASIIRKIDTENLLDTKFKKAYDMIILYKEEEGIKLISDFLEKSPNVWNGWFLLGWGCRRIKRFEEGYNAFKKVIDLSEKSADVYNEIAICCIELGKQKEAEKYLYEALKKEPENTKIISNLGIFYYKQEDKEKAKTFFLTTLEYDPEDEIAKKYLELLK